MFFLHLVKIIGAEHSYFGFSVANDQ